MGDENLLQATDTTVPAKVVPMQPLVIHQLTAEQVDALRGANFGKTIASTLFGFFSSGALSLWTTIKTVELKEPTLFAAFYTSAWVTTLGTIIAALIWTRAEWVSAGLAKRLKGSNS